MCCIQEACIQYSIQSLVYLFLGTEAVASYLHCTKMVLTEGWGYTDLPDVNRQSAMLCLEVIKWTDHLTPKESQIRIPDLPVTLVVDGNSSPAGYHTWPSDLRWFYSTPSFRVKVAGPFSYKGLWWPKKATQLHSCFKCVVGIRK